MCLHTASKNVSFSFWPRLCDFCRPERAKVLSNCSAFTACCAGRPPRVNLPSTRRNRKNGFAGPISYHRRRAGHGPTSPAPEKASPAPGKPSPRRTSNMSQASAVSSRQSFASEYSYHDSEGETPLKPVYNEETALAAALKESEQEEAFDRIAKQLEQSKIEEEGEAEEAPADDVASEAGSDAAEPIPSRAALAAVQNLSAPTPTKTSNGKKATCLHGNGPSAGAARRLARGAAVTAQLSARVHKGLARHSLTIGGARTRREGHNNQVASEQREGVNSNSH